MGIAAIKIVHALPGRIRVKISRLKGNPTLAREIQEYLSGLEGIRRVEVNLTTGSVLVFYDAVAMQSADSLLSLAVGLATCIPDVDLRELQTWLTSSRPGFNRESSAECSWTASLATSFSALNTSARTYTGGPDLKLLLPLALFLLGIRSLLVADKVTAPAWYDFLWFAFGIFFTLNPQVIDNRR